MNIVCCIDDTVVARIVIYLASLRHRSISAGFRRAGLHRLPGHSSLGTHPFTSRLSFLFSLLLLPFFFLSWVVAEAANNPDRKKQKKTRPAVGSLGKINFRIGFDSKPTGRAYGDEHYGAGASRNVTI